MAACGPFILRQANRCHEPVRSHCLRRSHELSRAVDIDVDLKLLWLLAVRNPNFGAYGRAADASDD